MCADEGKSNIWTIQNQFETKRKLGRSYDEPSQCRGEKEKRAPGGNDLLRRNDGERQKDDVCTDSPLLQLKSSTQAVGSPSTRKQSHESRQCVGIALAGLSVIGAVTAYGQIDARSQYGGAAAAVVDGKGNLRTPADYRTTYETLVFKTTTQAMTTGTVSSAGWFVMVKDHVGRFAGNKLWSDGWGWSWFDATTPQKTTSTDYTTDCQGCHVPARQSDWIYTHGYPVLTTNDL